MALMQQQMQQQQCLMEAVRSLAETNQQPRSETPVTPLLPKNAKKKSLLQSRKSADDNHATVETVDHLDLTPEEPAAALITPKQEFQEDIVAGKKRKLKRTLSYEQAFRAGKRQQKTAKERMLRKLLAARLTVLEPGLVRGEFHDEHDKFLMDDFFEKVAPIVYGVTGPPDDCSDDELPGKCLVMAKDIMKKRRQYLKKKHGNNHSKPSQSKAKPPPAKPSQSKAKPPPAKRAKRRSNVVAPGVGKTIDSITEQDVDRFFDEGAEAEAKSKSKILSYTCTNCKKSLQLEECHPRDKDAKQVFCKKCFDKNNKILDAIDLSVEKDKDAHRPKATKKSNPKANKKSKSKATKKSNPKADKKSDKYKVFDYVLAKYPGYGKKMFKAEVYAKYRGKYHLYFLEDDSTLKNVAEDALQPPGRGAWTKMKRSDFLKKSFQKDDDEWHAVEVGKGYRANKYGCRQMVGKPSSKLVWLSVSEVQKMIRPKSSS